MAQSKPDYRPDIDGIRALAVLLVIGFHTFPKAVAGGFIGVDVFFVISGFLISTILYAEFGKDGASGPRVLADFYCRRVRRIFPSLCVVLAACYALGFDRLLPDQFKRLGLHIAASAGFCLNLVFARETGYFDGDSFSKPLLHLWSLGIEEQFYLFWPIFIWLAMNWRIRLIPCVVFTAGISFFCNVYGVGASNASAFFLPQTRMWELLIGSTTALIYPKLQGILADGRSRNRVSSGFRDESSQMGSPYVRTILSTLGMALIGIGLVKVPSEARIPNPWTLCPTVGTALLICAGRNAWLNRRVLSRRVLVWIGMVSYPLYLWHWPLLCFSQVTLVSGQSITAKWMIIGLSALLAWATYVLVETPLRFGGRRRLKVSALIVAMLSIGALGYFTYTRGGFPSRFPRIIQELSDFSYDANKYYRHGTYYLDPGQDQTALRIDKDEISPNKPTLFLWGDSHAAQLYPGFKSSFSATYNIAQRTASLSPPFLGDDSPNLPGYRAFNDFVFESIKKDRPDCVVLAANWCLYNWTLMGKTITALKAAGIAHVVVVGPVPQWIGGLPQQIFLFYRTHPHDSLPFRFKNGLSDVPGKLEPQISALCARLGAEYISPIGILGNGDGFLIRFGDTADSLTAYDYGHLTKAGSEYLVSHFNMSMF